MPALLAMENFYAGYGPIEVLKGISIEVQPGEIVALIGRQRRRQDLDADGHFRLPAARVAAGLLRAAKSNIAAAHEIVRRGICQSPEGRKIFPRLTVLENLQMGRLRAPRQARDRARPGARLRIVPDSRPAPRPGRAARSRAANSRCWPSPAR